MRLKNLLYNLMSFLCTEIVSDFFLFSLTAKLVLSLAFLKAIHELLNS